MVGVIFICMVLCHLSFLVGDRLHLDVTGHPVLWLPGRPGGSGGPSESSEGSRELPGKFWDLLGRPGSVPGRRPINMFRR